MTDLVPLPPDDGDSEVEVEVEVDRSRIAALSSRSSSSLDSGPFGDIVCVLLSLEGELGGFVAIFTFVDVEGLPSFFHVGDVEIFPDDDDDDDDDDEGPTTTF